MSRVAAPQDIGVIEFSRNGSKPVQYALVPGGDADAATQHTSLWGRERQELPVV
jgi:hypothetical protein